MGLIKLIKNLIDRDKNSSIKKVTVTSSGAFYMKSEDLFDNNKETLELLDKLDKSVENHKKANEEFYNHSA